eukprot:2933541-Amphidinium_carterae.1
MVSHLVHPRCVFEEHGSRHRGSRPALGLSSTTQMRPLVSFVPIVETTSNTCPDVRCLTTMTCNHPGDVERCGEMALDMGLAIHEVVLGVLPDEISVSLRMSLALLRRPLTCAWLSSRLSLA